MSRMTSAQMHPTGVNKLGSPMGPTQPTGMSSVNTGPDGMPEMGPSGKMMGPQLDAVKGPIKHAVAGYNDGDEK